MPENATFLIRSIVGQASRSAASSCRIHLRRTPHDQADILVRFSSSSDDGWTKLPRVAAMMREHPAIAAVRIKGATLAIELSGEFFDEAEDDILRGAGASLECPQTLADQEWIIDYFDPTVTKAMHIGHLRNLALGMAMGALGQAQGARVKYQSVVGDMGRSIAEALAGYTLSHYTKTPESMLCKPDRFVGRCYSGFVSGIGATQTDLPPADQPIAREVTMYADEADSVVSQWLSSDPATRQAWRRLVGWVMEGHRLTLEACGIPVPEPVFESEHFDGAAELVRKGLNAGLLARSEDGRVWYPTGRPEYAQFPLLRQDGLPTQHLRTISAWGALLSRPASTRWVHILGDEWRISTECRIQLFRQLGYDDGVQRYFPVFHGMVTNEDQKMSSAAGDAVFVDDVIAELNETATVQALSRATGLSSAVIGRVVLAGSLLTEAPARQVQFDRSTLLDARKNPSVLLMHAYARSLDGTPGGREGRSDASQLRYMMLHAQALPQWIRKSWEDKDPRHVLRNLAHLADFCQKASPSGSMTEVLKVVLVRGCKATGLASLAG